MQIRKNAILDNKLAELTSLQSYDLLRLLSIPNLHCLLKLLHGIFRLQFPMWKNVTHNSNNNIHTVRLNRILNIQYIECLAYHTHTNEQTNCM